MRRLIGLDLHGLILDHRRAKRDYFRAAENVDYGNHLKDRSQIIARLKQLDYDEKFYHEALERFFHSDYALDFKVIAGARKFLLGAPSDWSFLIVTGRQGGVAFLEAAVKRANLPRVAGIVPGLERTRSRELAARNVALYFDDKPDNLQAIADIGIPIVQVSEPGYADFSPAAALCFHSWGEALASMPEIAGLVDV